MACVLPDEVGALLGPLGPAAPEQAPQLQQPHALEDVGRGPLTAASCGCRPSRRVAHHRGRRAHGPGRLALFGLSLLGRWELVPCLGSRWLLTNLVHDLALGVGLYVAATGIMGHKTKQRSFCNLPGYSQHCPYRAYLSASICGGITACLYLFSGLYCLSRRCQDQRDII